MNNLFTGQLVKLAARNPETDPQVMAPWHRDSEFFQLAYGRIAEPWGVARLKERMERHSSDTDEIGFAIHSLADDKLIGEIGLWLLPPHGEGMVYIMVGERALWGKGYGTDAMRVLLRYAFTELNLHRVSLRTFGFNQRAIRSYEKCGFVLEGNSRRALNKLGTRWDEVWMGILRSEWQMANGE